MDFELDLEDIKRVRKECKKVGIIPVMPALNEELRLNELKNI